MDWEGGGWWLWLFQEGRGMGMPCRLVIGVVVCKLWWFKGGIGLDLEAVCGMEPTTTTICHILGVYRTVGRKADRTAGGQATSREG